MATIRLDSSGWFHELAIQYPTGHQLAGQQYDVSAYNVANAIRLIPPNGGAAKNLTPTFTNTGADGLVRYGVPAGCYDRVGRWRVFFRVAIPGALNGFTSAATVDVERVE